MKSIKIFTVISALTLLLGMQVNAAEKDNQEQRLSEYASLWVGEYEIVSRGELTGEMPENVSYDLETNVLILNDFYLSDDSDSISGISATGMGDDFTVRLEGENTFNVYNSNPFVGLIYCRLGNLTIEGPGILNLQDVSYLGIQCLGDLTIDNCTINITGAPGEEGYFYGISGSTDNETETLIKESKISIYNTMTSGAQAANAGIDVQDGNLTVENSEIDIELENGNVFGMVAGQTAQYGGRLNIGDSKIKCITRTDMLNAGNRYNHNMYFYEMTNADDLYYYVQDGDAFIQKTFDEVFELGKYMSERYDSNYGGIVISSIPLTEYCSHVWDEGIITIEPSCENPGEMTYICTVCGATKTEEIAAVGHIWGNWQVIKEAACTEDGVRIRTCSRCNKTETENIPQTGHDFSVNILKKPTCTEPGLQERICSKCNLVIENEIIPATGHAYEWTIEKEATFHKDGIKKGVCNKCGDIITERIPKLSESHEHNFSGREEIIKPATCTEEGSKNIYCTEPECGSYITETIPMTAHSLGEWTTVKEASCSQEGLQERLCTVCGVVIETRVTDKVPHTYSEWTITLDPTCTEAGIGTAACTVCGETTVRGVNSLGHDYVEWKVTKERTCTEDGEESSVCTRCGKTDTRVVKATGHSFGEWMIVKESTLTTEGERQAVCLICGEIKSESIPKLSVLQPVTPEGNTNSEVISGDKSNVPKTGDESSILLYIIVLAGVISVGVIMGKKRVSK